MNNRINATGRIAIGSDHIGYPLKEELKKYLGELGYACQDFGAHSAERTDYPLFAREVTSAISSKGLMQES
jgi:ribose 5-phosphate isomerase B